MARLQLRYLTTPAVETIDAEDLDEANELARMRLLFREPGFGIAVYRDDQEVSRLVQEPKGGRAGFARSGWEA